MLSAANRSTFSSLIFLKILKIQISIAIIWIQYEKCIQMSTNKHNFGAVVTEIAPWTERSLSFPFFSTVESISVSILNNCSMVENFQPLIWTFFLNKPSTSKFKLFRNICTLKHK